ncbi:RodZ domain-containing protein [Thioalbus denitrificans]|nr:RodZ domain-containing protein [Thioalbus denitrificans]
METAVDPAEENNRSDRLQPGSRLRAAREARGLSTAEVAAQLHLTRSIIDALETDNYDAGPGPVFMRGYLRSYARLMGLPTDELLIQLDGVEGASWTEPPRVTPRPARTQARMSDRPVRWITYAIVGGIIALTVIWWRSNITEDQPAPATAPAAGMAGEGAEPMPPPRPVGSEPAVPITQPPGPGLAAEPDSAPAIAAAAPEAAPSAPPSPMPEAPAGAEGAPGPAAARTGTAPAPDDGTTAAAADSAAAEAEVGAADLRLTFSGECWVRITDGSGKVLKVGVIPAGETLEYSGGLPYRVVLGNAPVVKVEYRGEPYDHLASGRQGVARFTLGEGN